MSDPLDIPNVNMDAILQPLESPNSFVKASETLLNALETNGLVYLHFGPLTRERHRAVMGSAFDSARTFFARPLSEKTTATPASLPLGVTRGYLSMEAEGGGNAPEHKEAFSWSRDPASKTLHNAFEHVNIWPSSLGRLDGIDVEMKEQFDTLFEFLHEVICAVSRTLQATLSLNTKPNLEEQCKRGATISLLRAFYYHEKQPGTPEATGSVAHTDWGLTTLVAQEAGSTALEALINEEWRPVVGRPDTLVLNGSDFLTLISQGRLHSPRHRVVLTESPRLSFVFFQYPPFETPLPSLKGFSDEVLDALSLLTDQRPGAHGRLPYPPTQSDVSSFGAFIANKWAQVARDAKHQLSC